MFDFPDVPTANQTISTPEGVQYVWTGSKWTMAVAASTVPLTVPLGGTGAIDLPVPPGNHGFTSGLLTGAGTAPVAAHAGVGFWDANGIGVAAYGATAYLDLGRADGTVAAPTGMLAGEPLAEVGFSGFDGTNWISAAGSVRVVASEAWTTTAHGTELDIWNTVQGTASPVKRVTIGSALAAGSFVFTAGVGTNRDILTLYGDETQAELSVYGSAPVAPSLSCGITFHASDTGSIIGAWGGHPLYISSDTVGRAWNIILTPTSMTVNTPLYIAGNFWTGGNYLMFESPDGAIEGPFVYGSHTDFMTFRTGGSNTGFAWQDYLANQVASLTENGAFALKSPLPALHAFMGVYTDEVNGVWTELDLTADVAAEYGLSFVAQTTWSGIMCWGLPAGVPAHEPFYLMAGLNMLAEFNTQWFESTKEAYKPGGGMWVASSDIRVKRNVADYTTGLAALKQLRPVTYQYNGTYGTEDDGKTRVGLVADEAELIMPEMVGSRPMAANTPFPAISKNGDGKPPLLPNPAHAARTLEEVKTLDASALTYALINALKEIDTRLAALEAAGGVLRTEEAPTPAPPTRPVQRPQAQPQRPVTRPRR